MFVLHGLPQTIAPFVVWESWRTKCMKEVANSIILLFTGVETGVPQAPQTNCQPLLSSRISSINSSLSEVFRPNLLFMHIWARESLRSLSLIHVAGSRHIGKTVFTTTFAANIDQQLTVLPPLVLQSCSQGAFAFPKDQCHCLLGILSFWKGNGQREMENWRYVYPYFHPYHGDDFQGFVLRKKKLYFVCIPAADQTLHAFVGSFGGTSTQAPRFGLAKEPLLPLSFGARFFCKPAGWAGSDAVGETYAKKKQMGLNDLKALLEKKVAFGNFGCAISES